MTWNKPTSERKALIKRRLIKRQRGKCPLCGRSLVWWKGTLDHIIPKSKGGPDAEWNYQVVHDQCNGGLYL
ncbi:MAG: HNH endonuclease [Patescibacteria group bacterium]|nr:HNH endonuclease [Patescibacteria group bacterium]